MTGCIAAGHPLTAEAGAAVLRDGGNAVDAAVAATLASWAAEPLLTGPGAGGYMLVAGAGEEPVLLDFFVAAPGDGADVSARADLVPAEVSFGDALQVFHCGAASCGVYGMTAGLTAALERWGSVDAATLAAPAARLARAGVPVNAAQAYVFNLLAPILLSTEGSRGAFARDGEVLREGDPFRAPELAETIERFGADGAAPFYTGDIAEAVRACVEPRGGQLTAADLAAYAPQLRDPVSVSYRGRRVLTNPPPSAGGTLLAVSLAHLDEADGPPSPVQLVAAMEKAQALRTPEFASRLGSTTHISVLDGDGRACAVTCTNGEGSGIVVPGTGIHLNNVMGEEDLNPLGFFAFPPGRRMPSMMSPTVVLGDDDSVELVLGSAGSNRIRSAILQVIAGVVDHGLGAEDAVLAPRLHFEDGVVYAEPGAAGDALGDREVVAFRDRNLFFGGAQAIERDRATGAVSGAGDPRRGGASVAV